MATEEALSFLDIHRQHELEVTPYLSEDLKNNWELMWSSHVVNPEKSYVETAGYFEARKKLWYSGWVTICGGVGDGKSSMAEHLVTSFVRQPWKYPDQRNLSQNETRGDLERQKFIKLAIDEENRPCYTPVFVYSSEEYKQKVDHAENQIVVIDDIFGKAAFDWSLMEQWRTLLEDMLWNIASVHPKTLVVICVNKTHLEVAPGEITQLEWFRDGVMVDLLDTYKPTNEERISLMNSSRIHLIPKSELERCGHERVTQAIGLVYRLYSQVKSFSLQGKAYFRSPWAHCITAIDEVYSFDKIMYYTLCVAVLLDGRLDLSQTSLQDYDSQSARVMMQLIPALELSEQVDLAKMRFASRLLTGFFFNPVEKWVFEFTHPKVHYLVANSLCSKKMKKVLELCSWNFLMDQIRALDNNQRRESELVINCVSEYYELFAQRFTPEILQGNLKRVLQNESFENEDFVKAWFRRIKEAGQLGEVLKCKDSILQRTILYWSCFYGRGLVVREINTVADEFNLRSDVQFKKELIWGLQIACGSTSASAILAVKCLVEQGVYVNLTEKYQSENAVEVFGREMCMLMQLEAAPIHIAALKGQPEVIQFLISKGANVNEATADGCTPLHRAAMRRDHLAEEVVKVFLRNKAELNVKAKDNMLPLQKAVKCGSQAVAVELLNSGTEFDIEMEGKFMLLLAVQNRQRRLVKALLEKGVPPEGSLEDSTPPLSVAVFNGDIQMIDLLLSNKAEIKSDRSIKWPPFHLACYHGDIEIVKYLLGKGADVNATSYRGQRPLHYAAAAGMFQVCELLLSSGARTEAQNDENETPLVVAAKAGHQLIVWLLLREGMMLGDKPVAEQNSINQS